MAIRSWDSEGSMPRPRPTPAPKPRAPGTHVRTGRPVGRPSNAERARRALIPAAALADAPDRYTEEEEDLSAQAVETFTTVVGGRQALIDALAIADTGGQADKVVNALLDPRYNGWSIRRICQLCGITVVELFAAYKKAALVRAHIEATHLIASKLVPVVDDVMTRATPYEIPCVCQQTPPAPLDPHAPPPPPCPVCGGKGLMLNEPDLDRQKLALELGHLTEKRAGLVVNQTQGVLTPAALAVPGSGALEQLHQAVGELLFAPGRRRQLPCVAPAPVDVTPEPEAADADAEAP